MGVGNMTAGVLAAIAIGVILDYTGAYRKAHMTLSTCSLLAAFSFPVALVGGYSVMTSVVVIGIGNVAYHPTSYSYAAEMTFPMQPALVNAFMNFMAQMSCFIWVSACMILTDFDASAADFGSAANIAERQHSSLVAIGILCGVYMVVLVISCFIKEDLHRMNYSKSGGKVAEVPSVSSFGDDYTRDMTTADSRERESIAHFSPNFGTKFYSVCEQE